MKKSKEQLVAVLLFEIIAIGFTVYWYYSNPPSRGMVMLLVCGGILGAISYWLAERSSADLDHRRLLRCLAIATSPFVFVILFPISRELGLSGMLGGFIAFFFNWGISTWQGLEKT